MKRSKRCVGRAPPVGLARGFPDTVGIKRNERVEVGEAGRAGQQGVRQLLRGDLARADRFRRCANSKIVKRCHIRYPQSMPATGIFPDLRTL